MLMSDQSEPTTSELMSFAAEQHARAKSLKAELAQVEAVIEGLEELLLERIPPGLDSMAHVTQDGTKVTVKTKTSERYQPARGESDAFWSWAQTNGRWDMASRTVLQAGVKQFIADTGALPPGMERVTKTTAALTITIGAPRV
jgi:hypothetical protein